jgi:hypothetical protein
MKLLAKKTQLNAAAKRPAASVTREFFMVLAFFTNP